VHQYVGIRSVFNAMEACPLLNCRQASSEPRRESEHMSMGTSRKAFTRAVFFSFSLKGLMYCNSPELRASPCAGQPLYQTDAE